MWLLDADYVHPFEFSHRPATFTTSFHGQWTMDGMELYGTDMISMGNRYTVRGFDGEVTLMGTDGWYLRNEFATRFPKQKLGSISALMSVRCTAPVQISTTGTRSRGQRSVYAG